MENKNAEQWRAWMQRARATLALIWSNLRLAARELGNTLTNVLVPVASVLCALAEALQLSPRVVSRLKRAEQFLFGACATADVINEHLARLETAVGQGDRGEGTV